MRIAHAGIGELTVIMLDMETQWIEDALQAANRNEFVACVEKAQAVQVELMNVINVKSTVGYDVYSIFAFINKELIRAKIKCEPLDILRCKNMLVKLHKSFTEVAKTDQSGPVMASGEKVYAGLTYGASGLVESSMGGTEYSV